MSFAFSVFEIIYESSQAKPQLGQTIVKGEEFGVSYGPNFVWIYSFIQMKFTHSGD